MPCARGAQLTIARNLSAIQALGDVFLSILGLSLIPTVLIALSGGLYLARRSAGHVRTISGTLGRLTGGELDARIGPTAGWSSDLSAIGRKIDTMANAQEASVAAIRQVSSDIAHDFKTPIQRVAVYLNDLSDREGLDTASQGLLDKAKAELNGIVGVFHALLQIAQIETGSPRAGFEPVDLSELCATFREIVAHISNADVFESATETLVDHLIRRDAIHMIASHDAAREKLGHL